MSSLFRQIDNDLDVSYLALKDPLKSQKNISQTNV